MTAWLSSSAIRGGANLVTRVPLAAAACAENVVHRMPKTKRSSGMVSARFRQESVGTDELRTLTRNKKLQQVSCQEAQAALTV